MSAFVNICDSCFNSFPSLWGYLMSLIRHKSPKKPLTVRLDADVAAELIAVRQITKDKNLRLDVSVVVNDALRKALKAARAEIEVAI